MYRLIVALMTLLEECNIGPYDLDYSDLEDNQELIESLPSAKEFLENNENLEIIDSIMRSPEIQKYFRAKIENCLDFILNSN